ncbi:hypothetical protein JOB18_049501 [Solea senegalensis]|uniref:ENTH domain-containing protein n=1 Tax=Solea senegalensis TaxID=28829 RepID=A0AAV6RRE5_SOLSE|nr:AP-4 complex accessory subunit Tepsin isoform X2 [Solea senegalensis]KAG7507938.1 hypothetical protein JOB18_049501 [Solea senegalensis]
MATFMERLAFLQKVPTLMKATADDENPCPGYLFQEIGKISHESSGCGQCLLEYLLERLQVESCHVKLKVLKIFVHLCGHGSNHFLTELRRNSTFIQQASVYSGPPDPIHGTALYQKVRNTAQDVARLLFTDSISTKSGIAPLNLAPPSMGMGSATSRRSGMQGFGYSPGKQVTGADSLLDKIQKAAEVVASAVLPPTEHQGIRLHDNHYRAVMAPPAPIEVAVPACAYNMPVRRPKAVTQWSPGQVGGGWEETDSGNSSSHNSSQDIAANSRMSAGSKSAGTGSQSGASRESSGDLSERVEALQLGDCGQEMALISRLTEGSRVFLSREENQYLIKECSTLNCEVVVELLSSKLQDPSNTVKMRALCAVACLMTSDLLSLEQMFGVSQKRLRQLSEGQTGPVANKAKKILLQFEALVGGSSNTPRQETANTSHPVPTDQPPSLLSTHSGENTDLNHHESHTQLPHHPSFTSGLTRQDSPVDVVVDDGDDVDLSQVRTADDDDPQAAAEDPEPMMSLLSLFSGMELVTRGRPPSDADREATQMETNASHDDLRQNSSVSHGAELANPSDAGKSSEHCSAASIHSQPVSAFSFLQF